MASGPYCTQTDLELAVGGAAVLAQLLSKSGTGSADANLVAAVIGRATAEVNSAIQVAIAIDTLNPPYPDALVYVTADIGAYFAYLQGTSGQAMPDSTRQRYDNALRWLDQVARRERTLGVSPKPATDQDVKQVDTNPDGLRVTRGSLAGLW